MIATLNEWGAAWASWFGPLVLQNTLFLGLVFLALRTLRNAPPRVRAAVAAVGVVKLALPAFVPVARHAGEAVVPGSGAVSTLLFPFADGAVRTPAGPGWSGGLAPAAILMVAWASVAVSRLGFVTLQTLQLALAVRGSEDVDPGDLPADVRRSGLAVRRSPRIPMPLSFGPWPRTIYVPAAWDRWDRTARCAVLRHELAHVRRRDGLVLSLEILVQAAWFFHPLVFLLIRRLRTWREMACDDRCLAADPGARVAYTRFLAGLAETALARPLVTESASTLLRGRSELLSRVTHQLEESAMKPVPKLRLVLVTVLLAVAVAPLSLVLADPPPPPPPPAQKADAPEAAPAAKAAPAEAPRPEAAPAPAAEPAPEKVAKPGEAPAADVPPPPPPGVRVAIGKEGVAVNGDPVPVAAVGEAVLKHAQVKGVGAVVRLEADGAVPMSELHGVQDSLRKAGLHKVIYSDDLQRSLPLVLPPLKAKQALAELSDEDVARIHVDGAGMVTWDGKKIPGAKLGAWVQKRLQESPNTVFVLQTDDDTRYGAFVQVLAGLQEGGAKRIAVSDPGA